MATTRAGFTRENFDGPWGYLAYGWWESLLCCAFCVGLPVVFRDRPNVQTRLSAELARSQYTAYAVHVFFVLALQAAALPLQVGSMVKFFLVSIAAVAVTFAASSPIRRPLHL